MRLIKQGLHRSALSPESSPSPQSSQSSSPTAVSRHQRTTLAAPCASPERLQGILRAAVDAPLPLEIQGRALPGRGDSQVCEPLIKEHCLQEVVHVVASAYCFLACLCTGWLACLLSTSHQCSIYNHKLSAEQLLQEDARYSSTGLSSLCTCLGLPQAKTQQCAVCMPVHQGLVPWLSLQREPMWAPAGQQSHGTGTTMILFCGAWSSFVSAAGALHF